MWYMGGGCETKNECSNPALDEKVSVFSQLRLLFHPTSTKCCYEIEMELSVTRRICSLQVLLTILLTSGATILYKLKQKTRKEQIFSFYSNI